MIERILPDGVVAAESVGELPATARFSLFPGEGDLLEATTSKRRAEFAVARSCGRRAMARLGLPPGPILRDTGGAPRWPAGVVGSINHCAGYRAASVGREAQVLSVGIDAEPHQPLRAGLLELITVAAERGRLTARRRIEPSVCWDRLLFSAKESIFKAWFPLTSKWLDFGEVLVEFQPGTAVFTARLQGPAPEVDGATLAVLTGRWLVRDDLLMTAVTLSRKRRNTSRVLG